LDRSIPTESTQSSARRHLVAVWNPVIASDAMEQHIRVLQDAARKYRHGKLAEEQVYVWWGKLRSEYRSRPLPHLDEILSLEVEPTRDDPGEETHIYLTDYASLYVAHLGGIRRDPPEARDDQRVPALYRKLAKERGLKGGAGLCDCWFKLWDIRRLVPMTRPKWRGNSGSSGTRATATMMCRSTAVWSSSR
jgi:hypothetical protein